ncbi:MAG TPA: IS1380 family transposase [Epsilonproteobacteria bacterium]|nr:IS1380 family transposase [Campylobacterota bacterium]
MAQSVLKFAVESTNERLTPRAGEAVFGEFLKALGVDRLCNKYLPMPKSNRGYDPYTFIHPLLLMLHSGGRYLEDVRMIASDKALCDLLSVKKIPVADSIGKWLKRSTHIKVDGMESINRVLLRRYLSKIEDPLVLDIDATVIESHKSIAYTTYKMFPGFTPIIGHLNGGYVIHQEFREGNVAPADDNLSFVQQCKVQLPDDQKIKYLRADAASYQAALFNYCNKEHIIYVIGGHLDSSVLSTIEEIKEWEPLDTKEGKAHHLKEEVSEFLHTMGDTDHAFRIIVVKKTVTPVLHGIEQFLTEEELLSYASERYSVIATNSETMSAKEIVRFYRQRGDTSENRIKELKNGFNLKYLPTSNFEANALYFNIGTLAYNLFILFKHILHTSWQKHTIQTIRYKLYHIAGKVISHSRRTILKVNEQFVEILNAIRQKNYEMSLE